MAMMWELSVEAWTLSGLPLPVYKRDETPTRLYRVGEAPPDDGASS